MRLSLHCAGAFIVLTAIETVTAGEARQLTLELTEPAGVHRNHAPVHVLLKLPQPVPSTTAFRLTDQNRPVVAQFRPNGTAGETSEWWLDFLAESEPYQQRFYTVEYGPAVEPVSERTSGHMLEQIDDTFVITNAPYISWTIPRDLKGFLTSVDFPPSEHLRRGSLGLIVRDIDGTQHPLGGNGTRSKVVRHGKMAVALRFEQTETSPALDGVSWTADLTFPGPISWVELQLTIDDPAGRVAKAGLQLRLNLDPPTAKRRTLVDIGADRTVYRSLFGDDQVALHANAREVPRWQVLRTIKGQLQPFVMASHQSPNAEGWAHIMDRQRCLAIAFDQFGRQGTDQLNVSANGTLVASRRFAANQSASETPLKQWRMWLHFLHFPPQQSAATDPQMMQNPLIVRQDTQ